MSIFANLFTGTPGTQTQTNTLAPGAQSLVTNLFDRTSAMASQPYQPYDAARVASLTPDELAAMNYGRNIAVEGGNLYNRHSTAVNNSQLPGMLPRAGGLAGLMGVVGEGGTAYLPALLAGATNSGALADFGNAMAPGTVSGTLDLAQRFPDINIQEYMNPYVDEVVNPALDDVARRLGQQRNELNSRAARTGSFGGSRNAVAQQLLESEGQREMGRLSATERARAFNEAANQFRLDQTNVPRLYESAYNQLGAAQGLQRGAINDARGALGGTGEVQQLLRGGLEGMGMVGSLEDMYLNQVSGLEDSNRGLLGSQVSPLLASGGLQRSNEQANLDTRRSDWLESRDWNERGLNQLRQTLGLGSVVNEGRTTSGNAAGPSTAQQLLGGATALTGALGGIGGVTKAVGRASEGLSSLWDSFNWGGGGWGSSGWGSATGGAL